MIDMDSNISCNVAEAFIVYELSPKAGTIKDHISKTLEYRPRLRLIHFVVAVAVVHHSLRHRLDIREK